MPREQAWAQLAEPAATGALDLDKVLDSPLSTYSTYRIALTLVLASWWLICTDLYTDIWAAGKPDMARCDCATASGSIPFEALNYTHRSDNARVCDLCSSMGGEAHCLSLADHSTMAVDFDLLCDRDWYLGLPPSFDMIGVLFGALVGGTISDRHGRRPTYTVALFIFGGLFCLSAAAPTFGAYLTLKLLMGFVGSAGNVAVSDSATHSAPRLRCAINTARCLTAGVHARQ